MKKIFTVISINLLFTFYFQLLTAYAQTTTPILRLNSQMHTAPIKRISTDAQGKYILTASKDKTAKLWDAATGDFIRTFCPPIGLGNEGMLYAGAISPKAEIVAVAGWTGYSWDKSASIYIFNTTSGEILQRLTGLGNVINDLEFSQDGKYLAAALGGTKGVVIYKTNLTGLYQAYNSYFVQQMCKFGTDLQKIATKKKVCVCPD